LFSIQPLDDGDEFAVGELRLRALWRPGHTPEHLAYLLFAGFGANCHACMGWTVSYDRDIVLVTGDNAVVNEVVVALRQIGLDRVRGYLDDGMAAWTGEIATLARIIAHELALQREQGFFVLVVRSNVEWNEDHIDGAEHVFLGDIAPGATLPDTLGSQEPIAVICGSGYRSTVAASILQAKGCAKLMSVEGGMSAWNDAR
jgi:hydroxyacylglutathione hydrolase